MNGDAVTYIDSSAIVKLIVREKESAALRRHLRRRGPLVTSALARTEVKRAVLGLGSPALRRVDDVLSRIELVRVSNALLDAAGVLRPMELRSLDAIHLETAALFEETLSDVITYDSRMVTAAETRGWPVSSPS